MLIFFLLKIKIKKSTIYIIKELFFYSLNIGGKVDIST
jgi:hypothetical protein